MQFRAFHAAALAAILLVVVMSPALLLNDRLDEDRDLASVARRDHGFVFSRFDKLDPAREAVVLRAPQVGFAPEEVRVLRNFLAEGGGLLLVDDVGSGRDLLIRLGVGIQTTSARVFTPGFEGTPERIVSVSSGALVGLPAEVVVSRPVAVLGGTPLLVTPELAWLDLNDNSRADLGEPLSVTVLAAIQTYGRGTLVVVGDPDILGPSAPPEIKRVLLQAVAPEGTRLVFDEAHGRFSDPLALNSIFTGRLGATQQTVILILGLVLGALAVLAPRVIASRRRRAPVRISGPDARIAREALAELDRS